MMYVKDIIECDIEKLDDTELIEVCALVPIVVKKCREIINERKRRIKKGGD